MSGSRSIDDGNESSSGAGKGEGGTRKSAGTRHGGQWQRVLESCAGSLGDGKWRAAVFHPAGSAGGAVENGFIESFNGRLRDECLNVEWFSSLEDARQKLAKFRQHYNHQRPHSALADRTPAAFAKLHRLGKEKASTSMGRETRMKRGQEDFNCPKSLVPIGTENGSGSLNGEVTFPMDYWGAAQPHQQLLLAYSPAPSSVSH